MKNLLLFIVLASILGSNLYSESYHFVANDPYYKVPVKIDSINVYYMNTGKDTTVVSSSVHLETVTTVELNNDYSDVRLYPNPTNDILNIEYVSNNLSSTTITIVDLEGRKLYSQSEQFGIGKYNFNFNIAGLNQGLYFISIGSYT
ncbi:MAG: T9SS type A sorting domain-containing protein, partial [Candidatus Kapaibacterium sp.]